MFVKRVIEKDVNNCCECPYFKEEHEMGATLCFCDAINNSSDVWANHLRDISWRDANKKISTLCPFKD